MEDLQALDDFEEVCKVEDKARAIKTNKEYIKDKWNKNRVIKYITSLSAGISNLYVTGLGTCNILNGPVYLLLSFLAILSGRFRC